MDQTVITAGKRRFYLTLIAQHGVGEGVGLPAPLRREREAQAEILVGDRGHPARLPVGLRVAEVLEFRSQYGITVRIDDVPARYVDRRSVVGRDVGTLGGLLVARTVQVAQRSARNGADFAAGTGCDGPRIQIRGQLHDLVAVARPREVHVPADVLVPHGLYAGRYLPAAVVDFARVHDRIVDAGGDVYGHRNDLVRGGRVVERHVERQTAVEEAALDAELPALDVFGFEVVVRLVGRHVETAGEGGVVVVVEQLIGRRVVTHVGPRSPHLEEIDHRGVDVQQVAENDAAADRRIEIGVVARSQRTRPVVAAGDVEEYHVAPAGRYESVEAVDRLLTAYGSHFGTVHRVAQAVVAVHDQTFGQRGVRTVGLHHVVAAERCAQVEVVQFLGIAQQEVVVHLVVEHGLLLVHTVDVGLGALGFLLGAEIVVEVHAASQDQRKLFGEVDRRCQIAEHAVAVEFVELFVSRVVGVVAVGRYVLGAFAQVTAFAHPFLVVRLEPLGVHVGRIPQQRIHDRRAAVTGHRQVVAVLAVVVHLGVQLDVLVDLLRERYREGLLFVTGVGNDPVVAHVGYRNPDRGAFAVVAADRDVVVPRYAGVEESREEVARTPLHHRIGAVVVQRRPLVGQMAVELVAEGIGRPVARHAVYAVERIGVAAEASCAVFVLEIGPESGFLERNRRAERNAYAFGGATRLGRDDDGAVCGARSVQCRCGGTFQYGYVLDVFGVDVARGVTEVYGAVGRVVCAFRRAGSGAAGDGHSVDHEQGRAAVHVDGGFAAESHAHRSSGTRRRLIEVQTGDLA